MRGGLRIAAATALAAGVALAATPASARTVAPKGSCKLLTVSEVGQILGTPSGAGEQTTRTASGITGDRCVWAAKKKGTGGLKGKPLQLEVVVESGHRSPTRTSRPRTPTRPRWTRCPGSATTRSSRT